MTKTIPVYKPDLGGNEAKYVNEAVESSWISSQGVFLQRFEKMFGTFIDAPHVTAVSNGTVALHLALHCLEFKPGDEIIVPSFTYIASVNTIVQAGATPVFCEVRSSDWLMDPEDVVARITPRTKAILPVHLYGSACDMDQLCEIAKEHRLRMIEDCAEALGTRWRGRHVGTFGDVSTWSFFGNKTVTTGEGGMVATLDPELFQKMVIAKGQGQDPNRRYWHTVLGFNYRMTNLCAAIGTAQMERVDDILLRKRKIAAMYRQKLADVPVVFQSIPNEVQSSEWLVSLLLPKGTDRDRVMRSMAEFGVDTRPVFYCAHHMPPHLQPGLRLPVSEEISARGISLPSYPQLSEEDIEQVCNALREAL